MVPQNQPCVPRPASTTARHSTWVSNSATGGFTRRDQCFVGISRKSSKTSMNIAMSVLISIPILSSGTCPLRFACLHPKNRRNFNRQGMERPPLLKKSTRVRPPFMVSAVYFNASHTVALVYARHWCGGLCGQGLWIAVALEDGHWKRLPWNATSWIS